MTTLCLTLDYELFGSGKGDVFQHIIHPTERLLKICAEHGFKLTIFFEVVEYWRITETYATGEKMGYETNPAEAMREQIREAYRQGHDVQLHLHPQWIDAEFQNGEWKLNMDYWRLPDLPDVANDNVSMGLGELIRKGKQELESMLQEINPNYRCNILRAGGYNIDPSARLLQCLKQEGFIADSSVYYGGLAQGTLSKYDYSVLDNRIPYWFANGSLLSQDRRKGEFVELPIFAQRMTRILKYDWVRVRSALKNRSNSVEKFKNNSSKQSKWESLKFLLQDEALTWDFCLFPKSKMRNFLQAAKAIAKNSAAIFHPFVLVGHPKDFYYTNALDFLAEQKSKQSLEFLTLSEALERIHLLKE